MNCLDCRRNLVSQRQWVRGDYPKGSIRHDSRGLCRVCKAKRMRKGIELPPTTRPEPPSRDERLNAWVDLRNDGHSVSSAAEEMGIRKETLSMFLSRERRLRNDPRAAVNTWSERDEIVLQDWEFVRDEFPVARLENGTFEVAPREQAARRLGISLHTLDRVLKAARDRGDSRGNYILSGRSA